VSLIVDAAPVVALAMPEDPRMPEVEAALSAEAGRIVIPAQVTAEVDYLLRQRVGVRARRAFLEDLASGRFSVYALDRADYDLVRRYNRQYDDLDVGLSDLTVVVAAHRLGTNRLLTFDERHFRVLKPVGGGSFVVLPADSA
jgi:predicted nucleic acid-binding protein